MTLETTLAALQYCRPPFPEAAIRWAIEHPAQITPALLEALRETPAQTLEREPDYFFNIFAMYLLAQFREPAAYLLIVDYHAAIGEAEDELADELVTETLGRVLASLYPGDDTALRRLIEDPSVNKWVRSSVLDAYPALLAEGLIERAEVLGYFRYLLEQGLENAPDIVWNSVAAVCIDMHPGDLLPILEQAYAEDRIDTGYLSMEELRAGAASTPEQTLAETFANRSPVIVDAIEELSWWACFESHPEDSDLEYDSDLLDPENFLDDFPDQATFHQPPVTLGPKVGRNDPCPCGSGKKYKKCCLPKGVEYR